jgi:HEAT repeats
MRQSIACSLVALIGMASPAGAQRLAKNVTASDGLVQVIYPSRPAACGDGQNFIGNILGRRHMYVDDAGYSGSGSWTTRPCVHGPARIVATVIDGEVTRLRAYIGPVPPSTSAVRTIEAAAGDAAGWLAELLASAPSRVAAQAVLPLVLVDGPDPWPLLIKAARDEHRPRQVASSALQWLSFGVTEHLGLQDADGDRSDDDQMRDQAVFVLSQRRKSESVPELIDLARHAKHPAARKAAIFWLGQSGDPRAVDVYAELLGLKD